MTSRVAEQFPGLLKLKLSLSPWANHDCSDLAKVRDCQQCHPRSEEERRRKKLKLLKQDYNLSL